MIPVIIALLLVVLCYALSWAVTVGVLFLACLCFSFSFSLKLATGIWLGMLLVKWLFNGIVNVKVNHS